MNSKTVGERTEGMVLAALLRAGRVVLLPFGDNQRYDLVIEEKGRFFRVQCKTGRLIKGDTVVKFDTCSSQVHRGHGKQSYHGQIELFAVYSPDLDKVYIVPIGEVGLRDASLRLTSPERDTCRGKYRMAADYELTPENLARFID